MELQEILALKSIDANGCWNWPLGLDNGYGKVAYKSYPERVHRVIAIELLGYVPGSTKKTLFDGEVELEVLHKCNNRQCYNPDHLYIGTNRQNMRDKVRDGMSKKMHGVKGELNTRSKLKTVDILRIRTMWQEGNTLTQIGSEFSISFQHVSDIIHRRRWAHVR